MLGLFYALLTFFAITITGNHYVLDAVAGAILIGIFFAVMELGARRLKGVLFSIRAGGF